jgi:nicotinamide-nucleotide amidase
MFPSEMLRHAETVLQQLRARGMTLATAESCTGGLVSALLTEIAGSSDVFTHGYITYANAAKTAMVGVSESMLKTYGAVSEEVACVMAQGAMNASGTTLAVAITGIAGPSGATATKPVGLVHIACARDGFSTLHMAQQFSGDRSTVRLQAVTAALELVQRQLAV